MLQVRSNKVEQEIEKELVKMASWTNLMLASRGNLGLSNLDSCFNPTKLQQWQKRMNPFQLRSLERRWRKAKDLLLLQDSRRFSFFFAQI